MAFSYEPSGFQYNPLVPKLEDGNLLAGIKPLQIPQQGPVQISAPPAWTVPNLPLPPRVQGIESGITSAVNAIGQGITAAYKNKREDASEVRKAKIAADTKAAEQEETKRHHLEMERNAQERMKNVLPAGANWEGVGDETTSIFRKAPVVSKQSQLSAVSEDSRYQRHAPIKGGSFESINLPEEEDENGNTFRLQSLSSPLAGLTSPAPIESAPSPTGENALSALANTDWSQVTGSYASTGLMPVASMIPAPQPELLRKRPASLSTLGGISNAGLSDIQRQLAEMPMQSVAPIPAPETKTKYSVPRSGFNSYEEARKYMETQADNPNWYAAGTPEPNKQGKFVIPWKQQDPSLKLAREEAQKTREEAQKTREATAKSTEQNRMENTILRESRAFGMQKPVANFLRAGGTKELMMPFIAAYENSNKYPEAAGQAEVDMVDLLGRAMSGGKITVGQTQLIENAMSLKDKYVTKFKGKAFGGGFLPEPIKQQMVRTFTETYNYGADAANKVVSATKDRLSTSGIPAEKAGVYYYTGGHTPEDEVMLKSDALNRIKNGRAEIAQLVAEKANASLEEADIINKKIEAIKKRAKIFHDRLLEEADVESLLLGAKALQDRNVKEGFGGGDVGQIEVVPQ